MTIDFCESNTPSTPFNILEVPPYLEGESALGLYRSLLHDAFRADDGAAVGYYCYKTRGGFPNHQVIHLDGPDDERLVSRDSFDIVILRGETKGQAWMLTFMPLEQRCMFVLRDSVVNKL
jgi:hypothetical protein